MQLQKKVASVSSLKELFERSTAAVFVDFRGLDVPAITTLRDRFRDVGVEYRVAKNSMVQRALHEMASPVAEQVGPFLKGPTALAWSFEDPSAAAKVIKAFRKEGGSHEKLSVKGGLLEGKLLNADRVENQLALLPGKDELRAQLLAQLLAPAQSLVRQLHAPGQNFAYALDARKRQLEKA